MALALALGAFLFATVKLTRSQDNRLSEFYVAAMFASGTWVVMLVGFALGNRA